MEMITRRDILLVRADRGGRTYDLCCERLYRHFVHSRGLATGGSDEIGERVETRRVWLDASGSSPAPRQTIDDLFARLDRDLRNVDVLRVADTAWLARTDLWQCLQPVLVAFRERGGRLEYSPAPLAGEEARPR